MTTWVLVDPWLGSDNGQPAEAFRQWEGLLALRRHLADRTHLRVLGFLNEAEVAAFRAWLTKRGRADRQQMSFFASVFRRSDGGANPATIRDAPVPPLSRDWYCALASVLTADDQTGWRDPILITVAHRAALWPALDEVTVESGPTVGLRLLVTVEDAERHVKYRLCFDPWLYAEPVDARPSTGRSALKLHRLPRPPRLATNLPVAEWGPVLARCPSEEVVAGKLYYYFLPLDWEPENVDRVRWFERDRCFRRESKRVPGFSEPFIGPRDRQGRIWWWHREERHWDVQHESNNSCRTVSHTGEVLKDWHTKQ